MPQAHKFFRLRSDVVAGLIREQDLKRYWVAEFSGVHKTTLRRWLAGTIVKVRAKNVQRLAEVLSSDPARIAEELSR